MPIFKKNNKFTILSILLFFTTLSFAATQSNVLTLQDTVAIAIANDPSLKNLQANTEALLQEAVAAGQLSDPQLTLGAINVPTDTFSFNQDEMTMIMVGVQQSFPAGHSLAMKSAQTNAMAVAEQKRLLAQTLLLVKNVQETWFDLYYWVRKQEITQENYALLSDLLGATKSLYKVGKANQSDLLQIELELSQLDDNKIENQQEIAVLQAQLERWIGPAINRPLANTLPQCPAPLSLSILQRKLEQHPLLEVDAANIQANHFAVAYAQEQFKPGWMLNLGYGFRQGTMENGEPRADMATAEITMDLPLFTHQRQDRRLAASEYQLEATEYDLQMHYRDLMRELISEYAIWQDLSQRVKLYQQQLVPEAKQNAKATLLAYQSTTADLTTVLRAYMSAYSAEQEQLKIQIEQAKARVTLQYLAGEC